MFDFLREFGKSEEEKRQEALTAYLDDALTPAERERFEQHLASDGALRANLEEQRLIQASMRRLPRMPAPRNFTLDPALYGRPIPSAANRLYPILRTATAVVAVLFVFVLVLEFLPFSGEAEEASVAEEPAAEESPVAALIEQAEVEITREVEEEADMVAEAPAEAPAEEMAEEVAAQGGEPAVDSEAAPAEEAPAAAEAPVAEEAAVEEPSMADEGLSAAPEAESAAGQAAEAPLQPEATNTAGRSVESATSTLMAQEAPIVADDAATGQPTPGRAASPAAPGSDEMATDGAADDAPAPRTETRLTSLQIVAIILGLGLLVLIVATLLLRRRSRRFG